MGSRRTPRSRWAVGTFAAVLLLVLTGCSSLSDWGKPTLPTPTASGIRLLGDVETTGKTVQDARGSYETVEIRPGLAALAVWKNKNLLAESGDYDKKQVSAAYEFLFDYLGSQYIDSTALDTGPAGATAWVAANSANYLWAPYATAITSPLTNGSTMIDPMMGVPKPGQPLTLPGGDPVVLSNALNWFPQLVRDGGPRLESATFKQVNFDAEQQGKTDYLAFAGTAHLVYRAPNPAVLSWLKGTDPSAGWTDAQVEQSFPWLSNAQGVTEVTMVAPFNFNLVAQNKAATKWLIGGENSANPTVAFTQGS